MNADIRRRMAMAARVLDFSEAYPSTDASYVAVLARLKDGVARADALATQQLVGIAGEEAAIGHRTAVRASIQEQIRHLVRVAELLAKTDPELAGQFDNPGTKAPHRVFITAARVMLNAATPEKDFLISLGLGETFLDDLANAIAQFDAATEAAHAGRRDHVGARAELRALCADCMRQVGVLDGLNRARFKDNPEASAAWQSSDLVVAPARHEQREPPEPEAVPITVPVPEPGV